MTKPRSANFMRLKAHSMLGRNFKQLSNADLEFCIQFLDETSDLSRDEYAAKVMTLFVYGEKPKNANLIWALLLQAK